MELFFLVISSMYDSNNNGQGRRNEGRAKGGNADNKGKLWSYE